MYASPTEHQGVSSVQMILADADGDPALAQVDTQNPAAAYLGVGGAMGVRSSPLPRFGGRTVIAGANTDDFVGTRLAAVPIIAKARAGSATPGPALATGHNIEGTLA